MINYIKSGLLAVLLGALLMVGMRSIEYIIERPPTKLLICFADRDGFLGECKPMQYYIDKETANE